MKKTSLSKADGTILQDYGLIDICNSHDFLMIDTCAATDVDWISLTGDQRIFQRRFNAKYSAPVEQRIEYNGLIGLLFASEEFQLYTTEKVLEEIKKYTRDKNGGLLSSINQIITAIERTPKLISLEQTPEFEMYSNDSYFKRLAEMHGIGEVDQNLLLQFFSSLHNIDGKCALITNDRGILDTYKSFGYRLPGKHTVYTALFGQKYEPSFARK